MKSYETPIVSPYLYIYIEVFPKMGYPQVIQVIRIETRADLRMSRQPYDTTLTKLIKGGFGQNQT
jgi:hypothetical protein